MIKGEVDKTCRGKCKAHEIAGPKPNERHFFAKGGGKVYCKNCRTYMLKRRECPCDPHHLLRGGKRAKDGQRKMAVWKAWADRRTRR